MRSTRICIFIIATFISVISAVAQIPQGMTETTNARMGGNNFVVGTVFWPSGLPVDSRMTVKLRSPARGDVVGSTDESGKFIFAGVGEGTYFVVIEGETDFEPVNQAVDITQARNPLPQSYTLSIRLREKARSDKKPSVINADIAAAPKRASELYRKALDLSSRGEHLTAIEQLKLAIAEYPEFINAYNEMGVQYMRLNELEKADESLLAALKIKPDAFEPLLNRGITLFRLKRFTNAELALSSAIGAKDDSAIAHYYLGRALTGLERYGDAETELTRSITIGGVEMKEAYRMLANLFIAKGEDQRAIEALETYLKIGPNVPDAANLRKVIADLKAQQTRPSGLKPS